MDDDWQAYRAPVAHGDWSYRFLSGKSHTCQPLSFPTQQRQRQSSLKPSTTFSTSPLNAHQVFWSLNPSFIFSFIYHSISVVLDQPLSFQLNDMSRLTVFFAFPASTATVKHRATTVARPSPVRISSNILLLVDIGLTRRHGDGFKAGLPCGATFLNTLHKRAYLVSRVKALRLRGLVCYFSIATNILNLEFFSFRETNGTS